MDFEFKKVATPAIVKFLYFMSYAGLLVIWAALAIVGFIFGVWWGLAGLVIVGPALFIVGMLVIRIISEVLLILVRAGDDLHAMRTSGARIESGVVTASTVEQ